MADPSGLLEIRRQRANHMRALVDAGVSVKQIAADMRISWQRVYQLLAFADLIESKQVVPPPASIAPAPESAERPAWSYPDEITKRLVDDTRAEMTSGRVPPFKD